MSPRPRKIYTPIKNIAYKLQRVSGVNHRPLVYHPQSSPTPPPAGVKTGLKQVLEVSLNFQSLYTKSATFSLLFSFNHPPHRLPHLGTLYREIVL